MLDPAVVAMQPEVTATLERAFLECWKLVSDNLRKGAALNAVQIAELLGRRHLKKG